MNNMNNSSRILSSQIEQDNMIYNHFHYFLHDSFLLHSIIIISKFQKNMKHEQRNSQIVNSSSWNFTN